MNDTTVPTLYPGMLAAITLADGAAPQKCYVGQILAVDTRGVRLAMISWLTGICDYWEVYVPLRNIEAAAVASEECDQAGFFEYAKSWQTRMEQRSGEAE